MPGFLLDLWGFLAPLIDGDSRGLWNAWFRVPLIAALPVLVSIECMMAHSQLRLASLTGHFKDKPPSLLKKYEQVVGYQFLLAATSMTVVIWFIAKGPFEGIALLFSFMVGMSWNRLKIRRDQSRAELDLERTLPFTVRETNEADDRPHSERTLDRLRDPWLWGSDLVPGPSKATWFFVLLLLLLALLSFVVNGASHQFSHLGSALRGTPSPYVQRIQEPPTPRVTRSPVPAGPEHKPGAESDKSPVDEPQSSIQIEPGDNLWTLAETHCVYESHAELVACWLEWKTRSEGAVRSGDPNLIFPKEQLELPARVQPTASVVGASDP